MPTTSTIQRRRRETLVRNPLFAGMEFIDDADARVRRLPLMAENRDFAEPVGLNWTEAGTDVDFGALSKQLLAFGTTRGMDTLFGHEVRDLHQESDGVGRSRYSTVAPARSSAWQANSSSSAPAAGRCRC